MRNVIFKTTLLAILAVVAVSCSTTKRIPEGEQLYTGLKGIEVEAPQGQSVPEGVSDELKDAVSVAPNNAIFGSPSLRWPFPLGLWVWNNWNDPGKGLKHWLTTGWSPSRCW